MAYRCTNDTYDPDGTETYDSVEDFLHMCDDCFGERPEIVEQYGGDWCDESGAVVLELAGDDGGGSHSGHPLL